MQFSNSLYSLTSSISDAVGAYLDRISFSKAVILVDENTRRHCLPLIENNNLEVIEIPSGETHKTLRTCEDIWMKMTELGLDRSALMLNLGGGVIGDMGGFCASTYKRGIRFVNIPTTLLAQVDASVGGKLGVDFHGLKNHIGVFNNPETVIIAPEFLKTLRFEEIRSGFAEILKHGLINDSAHFYEAVKNGPNTEVWEELILRSVQIKEQIVRRDPKESGERKLLNFGHTIGHAIETFYLGTKEQLLHGEAVAIGMFCESYLSNVKSTLKEDELSEILKTLHRFYDRSSMVKTIDADCVKLMIQDKKNKDNRILATLLTGIGSAQWDVELSESEARQAIDFYNKYQA